MNRRKQHLCNFIYYRINNNIDYDFNLTLFGRFYSYNIRNRNNLRNISVKRQWDHQTVVGRAIEDWNDLDLSVQTASMNEFKRALSDRFFNQHYIEF